MAGQALGQEFLADLSRFRQDLPYSPALLRDLFSMTGERSLASLEAISESPTGGSVLFRREGIGRET